jgi:hypothetical protein
MENTGLISSYDEARTFAKHPIKPFDPFYTRDFDTWNTFFSDFKAFIRNELIRIITVLENEADDLLPESDSLDGADLVPGNNNHAERKLISELYLMWYGTLKKIKQYDSASGQSLMPTNCGRHAPFTRF